MTSPATTRLFSASVTTTWLPRNFYDIRCLPNSVGGMPKRQQELKRPHRPEQRTGKIEHRFLGDHALKAHGGFISITTSAQDPVSGR